MEAGSLINGQFMRGLGGFLRKCMFNVISVGPIPAHVAFIMDGNRRFAKKHNLAEGEGHKAGFSSLLAVLNYCYELGIKYVTVYAFSIDNFRRKPEIVKYLMSLMLEKIEEMMNQESVVNQYGIRLLFVGDLSLLADNVREAAEKAMKATAKNRRGFLLVCVAYTSTDEMAHAIEESCKDKFVEFQNGVIEAAETKRDGVVKLGDVEKKMYMAVAPDPDILIRSSGELRLSNFLTWQTEFAPLYSPAALWPELGLWHIVWGVLIYQRSYAYLEKSKKHS